MSSDGHIDQEAIAAEHRAIHDFIEEVSRLGIAPQTFPHYRIYASRRGFLMKRHIEVQDLGAHEGWKLKAPGYFKYVVSTCGQVYRLRPNTETIEAGPLSLPFRIEFFNDRYMEYWYLPEILETTIRLTK